MIRAAVFDFGMVLASPDDLYGRQAAALGVPVDRYYELYWADRRAYDEGLPVTEYWSPILQALGIPATDDLCHSMARLDALIWSEIRESAKQILADVRASGTRVVILSNAPIPLDDRFREVAWRGLVDDWFVSGPLGMTKPSGAIYEHVQRGLNLPPDEIAFIDDRPANVEAALAYGWHAHLWVDDADTRSFLASLGVLAD